MAGFAHSLEESLQRSIDYAAKKNHEHVTVEHLLFGINWRLRRIKPSQGL